MTFTKLGGKKNQTDKQRTKSHTETQMIPNSKSQSYAKRVIMRRGDITIPNFKIHYKPKKRKLHCIILNVTGT